MKQPFCDGRHFGTKFKPLKFALAENKPHVFLCGCKLTKEAPFCDGKTCVELRAAEQRGGLLVPPQQKTEEPVTTPEMYERAEKLSEMTIHSDEILDAHTNFEKRYGMTYEKFTEIKNDEVLMATLEEVDRKGHDVVQLIKDILLISGIKHIEEAPDPEVEEYGGYTKEELKKVFEEEMKKHNEK